MINDLLLREIASIYFAIRKNSFSFQIMYPAASHTEKHSQEGSHCKRSKTTVTVSVLLTVSFFQVYYQICVIFFLTDTT